MLVLTRRQLESIVLPELGIEIKVISTGKGTTKIGISAPPEIRVFRGEVHQQREIERKAA